MAIIDDLLLKCPHDYEPIQTLARRLTELAEGMGGKPVKVTHAPNMWGGLQLERSLDRMTITISMPEHIEATTRKWLPTLAETGIVPTSVPSGKKLQQLLDSLVLLPGEGPLNKFQKRTQEITGGLRWMCRVVIRILRHTHRAV